VIESELYGLPLPAHAEIVLEGEMIPGDVAPEDRSASSPATTPAEKASNP